MLKLYNTLTKTKEIFWPQKLSKVSFYHCGPTVYWTQHIGNLRGMLMGDLIHRTLLYLGYKVKYIQNYTDVGHLTSDDDYGEDKMEKTARLTKQDPMQIAARYIKEFETDTTSLNILPPYCRPRATNHITLMQDMVKKLLEKKIAYQTDLAIYFDVSKFPDYTALSRQNLDKNEQGAGAGEIIDSDKKNPADFALWFFKAGTHAKALQWWESPFESELVKNGAGFPGWHIECSAMAQKYLGATLDIHMGGIEHITVHHTNEIAQSQCYHGQKYVNYWVHNEHLLVNNEKMSKSKGTSYTLSDVKKNGFTAFDLRYFFLNAHYRSSQNFTWEGLKAAQTARVRLESHFSLGKVDMSKTQLEPPSLEFKSQFTRALEDDCNVPQALATTWQMIKSKLPASQKNKLLIDFDKVLGLGIEKSQLENNKKSDLQDLDPQIKDLLKKRQQAREQGNWTESDQLRQKILDDHSLVITDTSEGQLVTTIEKNSKS